CEDGDGLTGVAELKPEDLAHVESRVREEDLACSVDALQQRLVRLVAPGEAETDERERSRRGELPAGLVPHPPLEERGKADRLADALLQPAPAVATQHRPELERAETATQRDRVLAQADDVLLHAQELGHEAEGTPDVLGSP